MVEKKYSLCLLDGSSMLFPPGHSEPSTLAPLAFPEPRLTELSAGQDRGMTLSQGLDGSSLTQRGTELEALARSRAEERAEDLLMQQVKKK